jgi:hypothetical protein
VLPGCPVAVGGTGLSGAVVEACRGDSGVVLDSALTDDSGAYRVGNLKPGNTYLMRVKLDGRVVSAHPTGKKVWLWPWGLAVGCWEVGGGAGGGTGAGVRGCDGGQQWLDACGPRRTCCICTPCPKDGGLNC